MLARPMRTLLAIAGAAACLVAQDPVSIDPRHYTVELENDRVRALRVRYGPGEGSPMHEHPAGVGITMTPTKSTFQMPDGSTREGGGRPAGVVFWREATRHANRNLLGEAAEMIEMDLKNLPNERTVALVLSPKDPSGVEMENQFVRVLRVRIPANGKTSPPQQRDRVAIMMDDQQLRWTTAGRVEERTFRKGQALWLPANTSLLENTGNGVAESFLIELK